MPFSKCNFAISGISIFAKLSIEPDEAPAAHGAGAFRPVHRPAHEAFRISDREQDGAAVMPRYEQEIPASGFPRVIAGTGNIHGIAVTAFRRLKETGYGGVADTQHWVHHESPPWEPQAPSRISPRSPW